MRKMIAAAVILAWALPFRAEATSRVEALAADIPAVLRQAKKDAAVVPAVTVTGIDVRMDCKNFIFDAGAPERSAPQDLRSETWLEECDDMPFPGHGCIPSRRLLRVDERAVTIVVKGRAASAPKEVFQVCLWGSTLSFKVKQSPNKYDVQEKTEFPDTLYILTRKP